MNTVMVWAGAVAGFLIALKIPLPRWRLPGALAALSLLVTGSGLAAMAEITMKQHPAWMSAVILGAGVMGGLGLGYFFRWFRSWK